MCRAEAAVSCKAVDEGVAEENVVIASRMFNKPEPTMTHPWFWRGKSSSIIVDLQIIIFLVPTVRDKSILTHENSIVAGQTRSAEVGGDATGST